MILDSNQLTLQMRCYLEKKVNKENKKKRHEYKLWKESRIQGENGDRGKSVILFKQKRKYVEGKEKLYTAPKQDNVASTDTVWFV